MPSAAQQQHHDIRALHEPAEREDPRNALLDTMAQQILDHVDAARRNDCLAQLLSRIETHAPLLAAFTAAVREAEQSAACPQPSMRVVEAPAGVVIDVPHIAPLDVAEVLTTLKLADSFRMSREHRALFDAARAIVRRWADAARPARRAHIDPPPPAAALGVWDVDAGGGA